MVFFVNLPKAIQYIVIQSNTNVGVLLRYFVDGINTYNQLTLKKGQYP